MGLITKEVEVTITSSNINHLISKGYAIPMREASKSYKKRWKVDMVYDFGAKIVINVHDLLDYSKYKVLVKCDYCGKEYYVTWQNYLNSIKTGKIACTNCEYEKIKELNYERYGVTSMVQLQSTIDKMAETKLKRYGNPFFNNLAKTRQTNIDKYGVPSIMQVKEIREKASNTMYKNGTIKTSQQQLLINKLYRGSLNYPCIFYSLDIAMITDMIDVEYDGGGHRLRAELGKITQEEFDHKELIRDKVVKSQGYKIMRIISRHDYLPSDNILLEILEISKQYFKDNPERSWINWDIDNGIYKNALNLEGVLFNYGKLRTLSRSA